MIDLAQVLDLVVEVRRDVTFEVVVLDRLAHLADDLQRHTRLAGDIDGAAGALVGRESAQEHAVAAVTGAERKRVDVDAVVDDARDGDVGGGLALRVGDGDDRHAGRHAAVDGA